MKAGSVYRLHLHLTVAATLHIAACAPLTGNTVVQNARPDPSSRPVTENQKKDGEVQVSGRVDGNTVYVSVQKQVMCRDLKSQAMIGDSITEHSLTPEARTFQWILGGTAIVGGALGTMMIASKCTMPQKNEAGQAVTDQSGQPVERPCTSAEATHTRTIGGALIGVGVVAGGLFAVNAIRTSNSHEHGVPAHPQLTMTEWSKCDSHNASQLDVSLKFVGGTLRATTDAEGAATFDFSGSTAPSAIEHNSTAVILIASKSVGQVDLVNLAIFPEWKSKIESERATAAADAANRQAERQKKAAEEKARVSQLVSKCTGGEAIACYALGEYWAGSSRGTSAMKRACELEYNAGCIAYQEAREQEAEEETRISRERATRLRNAYGPKRSFSNPADVAALKVALNNYQDCEFHCARTVNTCISSLPDYGSKAQLVEERCNPAYKKCQMDCESALNRQGFCTTLDGSGAGPCP